MINENEEKAKEFLIYVTKNEIELKRNLKKNITYNPDIFDDVFCETILKIYESILKNGTNIKDYKQYFYISSKWNYILKYNKYKENEERLIRNDLQNINVSNENEIEQNERNKLMIQTFIKLKSILKENFEEEDINLFLKYYNNKTKGKYTLKQLAEDSNLSQIQTAKRIRAIKEFINTNEEIRELKKLI